AVRAGGGFNHRRDLGDAVLIKDNHLAVIRALGLSAAEAIEKMRLSLPHTVKIEIEVDRIDQLGEVLKARPEIILLDNMSTADLTKAAGLINGRATTEASGGVSLGKVGGIAASGGGLSSFRSITPYSPAFVLFLG